jgi:hypothetical protein
LDIALNIMPIKLKQLMMMIYKIIIIL